MHGASGRRVLKERGEDVCVSKGTETDEEMLLIRRQTGKPREEAGAEKPRKRKETETEEEEEPSNKVKRRRRRRRMDTKERQSRKLVDTQRPADPKAYRSRSIEVMRRMVNEEESVKRRRLTRGVRESSATCGNTQGSSRWWNGVRRGKRFRSKERK
jgi:hypothetical protein